MLTPPQWVFFENRAGLAAKFGEFLVHNVVTRPLGTAKAMTIAGVRPLGSAVNIEVLEFDDPIEDTEVAQRILERRNHVGRVLEAQVRNGETEQALKRLESLRCEASTRLLIQYSLHLFNHKRQSDPEVVPALIDRDTERLLIMRRNGQCSWPAIARELAIALCPDDDPGQIAAGLKEALAADSANEAATILDELGFARLDTNTGSTIVSTQPVGSLGDGTMTGLQSTIPPAINGSSNPETVDSAVHQLLGVDTHAPTPPPFGIEAEFAPGAKSNAGKATSGPSKDRPRPPILRSYIPAPNSETATDEDEDNGGRSPVDEAGVRHVLDYESRQRFPKEMPHKNRGYDIESRDGSGNIVRYIEVKSFSGAWNMTYAVLSRPQFDKASTLGDAFWLYVVERAEFEDFRIHRVQNPAQKANHFMFDDGWKNIVERDDNNT